MYLTFCTHSKREIKLIERSLEYFIEHSNDKSSVAKAIELKEKVRDSLFYQRVSDLYVRDRESNIVKPTELSFKDRINFVLGKES